MITLNTTYGEHGPFTSKHRTAKDAINYIEAITTPSLSVKPTHIECSVDQHDEVEYHVVWRCIDDKGYLWYNSMDVQGTQDLMDEVADIAIKQKVTALSVDHVHC